MNSGKPNKEKVNDATKLTRQNTESKEEKMPYSKVWIGKVCDECYEEEEEEVETNCVGCGDWMSDVDEDDYKEGCNTICDRCDPPPPEEEEEIRKKIKLNIVKKLSEDPKFIKKLADEIGKENAKYYL